MRLSAIALLGFLAVGASPAADLKLGDVVPDIAFKAYDGKEYKLSDFRDNVEQKVTGKVTIIYFQSETCPAAISPSQVIKVAAPYTDPRSGVKFIAVFAYSHDNEKNIEKYIVKRKLPYTCAWDTDKKLRNLFQAKKVNVTYVMDKEGKLIYRGGLLPQKTIAAAVAAAQGKGKAPDSDGDFAG